MNTPDKLRKFAGHDFIILIKYDHPNALKGSANPCRARVNLRLRHQKKYVTKRQINGVGNDTPLDYVCYGVDERAIYAQMSTLAADLRRRCIDHGLLDDDSPSDQTDLAALLSDNKDIIMALYYSRVAVRTRTKYDQQYDLLLPVCRGIIAEQLDDVAYKHLLDSICVAASETSREYTGWQQGDEVPPSASTRINLLRSAIDFLKGEGVSIPATPTKQDGLRSRDDCIMDLVDKARSFPPDTRAALISIFSVPPTRDAYHLDLLQDIGTRFSEFLGILWGNVHRVCGSQGYQYYVVIDGQLYGPKRSEYLKSSASYRKIPLSGGVGAALYAQKQALCSLYSNVATSLLFAVPDDTCKRLIATPAHIAAHRAALIATLNDAYASSCAAQAIINRRMYHYDDGAQNEYVMHTLTRHALRRDFCTQQYCAAGYDITAIYQSMGHDARNITCASACHTVPNERDMYNQCLIKGIAGGQFGSSIRLQYTLDARHTEVPTCKLGLSLPANSTTTVTVLCAEPNVSITANAAGLTTTQRNLSALPFASHNPLLVEPEERVVQYKDHLFPSPSV